jgi:hypothetical protein
MRPALVLFAYAAALMLGAPLLARARWPERSPRLAIAAWQSVTASALLAVILGGLVLAVPTAGISGGLGALLRACAMALQVQYFSPGGAALSVTGLVLAAGVASRCLYTTASSVAHATLQRRTHRDALALIGRPAPAKPGVIVIDDDALTAYCLPGRGAEWSSRAVLWQRWTRRSSMRCWLTNAPTSKAGITGCLLEPRVRPAPSLELRSFGLLSSRWLGW